MTTSLRKKHNMIKLKIAKRNAAQLQAQLGAQLNSQLLPKIELRNLENEDLLRTCSALKLQIFEGHVDEFIHYLPGQDEGLLVGLISLKEYQEHCNRVSGSACWGGQLEILVLWKVLKVAIHVFQVFPPSIKVSHKFLKPRDSKALTISPHHKLCGL
ncbi:hypothetical protein PtB15_9B532 [Puccinia triticina]|nr:hypothetical protein PtB15_9B532 [Puccinia triticina]